MHNYFLISVGIHLKLKYYLVLLYTVEIFIKVILHNGLPWTICDTAIPAILFFVIVYSIAYRI